MKHIHLITNRNIMSPFKSMVVDFDILTRDCLKCLRELSCVTLHIFRRCMDAVREFNPFLCQRPDNWRVIGLLIMPSLVLLLGAVISPCCHWVLSCCSFLIHLHFGLIFLRPWRIAWNAKMKFPRRTALFSNNSFGNFSRFISRNYDIEKLIKIFEINTKNDFSGK